MIGVDSGMDSEPPSTAVCSSVGKKELLDEGTVDMIELYGRGDL